MASSNTPMDLDAPAQASTVDSKESKSATEFAIFKERIYAECCDIIKSEEGQGRNQVFYQSDLLDLAIVPDDSVEYLLRIVQSLLNEKLFKPVSSSEGLGWRVRTEVEAQNYRGLTQEQELVYGVVDESEADGIWSKTIKGRLNLHLANMDTALKQLQQKGLISQISSVQGPHKKMWIKAHLRPSEKATGGSWYTDNELDEAFIKTICDMCYAHIKQKSFYFSASAYKNSSRGKKKMSSREAKAERDRVLGSRGVNQPGDEDEISARSRKYEAYFPMPADYVGYPNVDEITSFVHNTQVTQQVLVAAEIQQLLDVMVFDGKIERVILESHEGKASAIGYKATRKTLRDEHEVGSVFNEAPCGRCPVFDICAEGGPVSPKNCEYLEAWLKF